MFNFDKTNNESKKPYFGAFFNKKEEKNREEKFQTYFDWQTFFDSFKKAKVEYENLSIRIDKNLKKWCEKLAHSLNTSVSKIVERALSMIKRFDNQF